MEDRQGLGALAADLVVNILGSWPFVIIQSLFFAGWMIGNAEGLFHFDPAPWLRMNIIMSIEAAYATSLVLISDRRQAARSRKQLHYIQQLLEAQHEHGKAITVMLQDHRDALKVLSEHSQEVGEELDRIGDILHDADEGPHSP